jgi:hypothetical protein
MKGDAPAIVFARLSESAYRFLDLLLRAYGIAERHRDISANAIGDEAVTRGIEEVGLIWPELEVFERRTSVPINNLSRVSATILTNIILGCLRCLFIFSRNVSDRASASSIPLSQEIQQPLCRD